MVPCPALYARRQSLPLRVSRSRLLSQALIGLEAAGRAFPGGARMRAASAAPQHWAEGALGGSHGGVCRALLPPSTSPQGPGSPSALRALRPLRPVDAGPLAGGWVSWAEVGAAAGREEGKPQARASLGAQHFPGRCGTRLWEGPPLCRACRAELGHES